MNFLDKVNAKYADGGKVVAVALQGVGYYKALVEILGVYLLIEYAEGYGWAKSFVPRQVQGETLEDLSFQAMTEEEILTLFGNRGIPAQDVKFL